MNILKILGIILVIGGIALVFVRNNKENIQKTTSEVLEQTQKAFIHPLSIAYLKSQSFEGSDLTVVRTLSNGSNYSQAVVSYESEGNTIYALLTIPLGEKPETGWPVVVFNHGYIPPAEYQTTERYVAYVDAFARNGYIVIKSDYRGHGDSEGEATGGYGSNDYTIDVLNALASIKKHPDADPERIGMWGHSMGGFITLRSMVVSKDIKAGVIWAGVVASYEDLLNRWRRRPSPTLSPTPRGWRQLLTQEYGTPETNRAFWESISANYFLSDISGPVQIHHGTADTSVPVEFSQKLNEQLKEEGKEVEYYEYPGDDHNISQYFSPAIQRSVAFFDEHVK